MKISCIVLAGGKGYRLKRDKMAEIVGSRSLLERVLSRLSVFDSEIIIVTARGQSPSQSSDYPGLRIVGDIYLDRGPLGGIYTGLVTSSSTHNLVVACDMPFLNQALLRYMIRLSAGFDLVVPRLGNLVEPLHAVYSKSCLTSMESLLKQNNLGVSQLFAMVKVRYVEADEIGRFDREHLSFFNINTEADLEMARKLAEGERLVANDKR